MNINKNMFADYDDTVKCNELNFPKIHTHHHIEQLASTTEAQLFTDIRGRYKGIRAPQGSTFKIYFSFDGEVENSSLEELLADAEIGFEVRNTKHVPVFSSPVEFDADNLYAAVDIVSEKDGCLTYGTYYIYLYACIDGIYYTLFDEHDGVLSIE